MRHADRDAATSPSRKPAAQTATGAVAVQAGHSAQRQLIEGLARSPRSLAQRRSLDAQFGAVAQRLKFPNSEAKFRTDNEVADIDNSEYHVLADGYKRYAPINKYRAPSQFFHEGSRTFMYFDDNSKLNELLDVVDVVDVVGTQVGQAVEFAWRRTGTQRPLRKLTGHQAHWSPQDGLQVMDCNMFADGTIDRKGYHPGHAVEDLGRPLPELDQPDKLEELRKLQSWMKYILATGQIRGGKVGEAELSKAFEAAHAKGVISQADLKRYEDYKSLIDDIFGGLEKELRDNWSFWIK